MCMCRTNWRQERRQRAVGAESVSARQRSGWSRDLVEWSPVCCSALPRISTIEEALKAAEGDADSRRDPLTNRGAVCKCSPKMSQGLVATGLLTASWHKVCVLRAAYCVLRAACKELFYLRCFVLSTSARDGEEQLSVTARDTINRSVSGPQCVEPSALLKRF